MCLRPKITNSDNCLMIYTLKRDDGLSIRQGRCIDVRQQRTENLYNLIAINLNLDIVTNNFPGKISNRRSSHFLQERMAQSHQITALAPWNKHSCLDKRRL